MQLIAERAVTLMSELAARGRTLPKPLLEQALDSSVERRRNVFHQLLKAQCRVPGNGIIMRGSLRRESQPEQEDTDVRRSLTRRQLWLEFG